MLLILDEEYTSTKKNNNFDVFIRHDLKEEEKLPTILWVHGGAFVAGDKSDVKDYMYVLANEGYVVISMNYAKGYESKYPTPLIQINELYDYLKANSDNYKYIDLDNLVIGGDSAGAFIVAQYALIQTNSDYSNLINIDAKIAKENIKGLLLFCGPYDFNLITNLIKSKTTTKTNFAANKLVSFLVKKVGEAYLGDKDWSTSGGYEELTLTNYITEDYPKTFITDGNTVSFEDHGRVLEEKLQEKNVNVQTVFYEANLFHEYQFNLGTVHEDGRNYALETLEEVKTFLNLTFNNT